MSTASSPPTRDTTDPRPVDGAVLGDLVGQAVGDFGAILNGTLVVMGDRLGLFRAMADGASLTPAELAERTGTATRNVAEWASAQAAAGYVTYDGNGRFSLSPEQAEALTNEDSPSFVVGGFQAMTAATRSVDELTEAFRSGTGFAWGRHDHDLFHGTRRFFKPGYQANLVSSWIPALTGVEAKLDAGARVADVGCGHGASTMIMAQAYPRSTFVGYDAHEPSIDAARQAAVDLGLEDQVRFEVGTAKDFAGQGWDLVCFFDCLHDMGDPVGALTHTLDALAPDGSVLLVEPFAGDCLEDNLNPVGRVFYAASSLICTPASQSEEVGLALGAQAGEARWAEVVSQAGFTQLRRATETPFNLVLEILR